jgi:hypothetical protein
MLLLQMSLSAFVRLWQLLTAEAQLELQDQPETLVQLGYKVKWEALAQPAQAQPGQLGLKELPAFKAPLGQQAVRQMRHNCKG